MISIATMAELPTGRTERRDTVQERRTEENRCHCTNSTHTHTHTHIHKHTHTHTHTHTDRHTPHTSVHSQKPERPLQCQLWVSRRENVSVSISDQDLKTQPRPPLTHHPDRTERRREGDREEERGGEREERMPSDACLRRGAPPPPPLNTFLFIHGDNNM